MNLLRAIIPNEMVSWGKLRMLTGGAVDVMMHARQVVSTVGRDMSYIKVCLGVQMNRVTGLTYYPSSKRWLMQMPVSQIGNLCSKSMSSTGNYSM